MGDFWDAWWQQTYQVKSYRVMYNSMVKSIVLGHVRMLRTTYTMEIYLVSLLPPSAPKSPIDVTYLIDHGNDRPRFLQVFNVRDLKVTHSNGFAKTWGKEHFKRHSQHNPGS